MHIIAITVDYQHHEDTYACLDSLLKCGGDIAHIIVIDNGSTPPLDLAAYPAVELIRLDSNLGFAGGFNYGLQRALVLGAEVVLVLNNDTIAAPDMVSRLAAELIGTVGITAPRIFYETDPQRIWSDGFDAHPLTLEMIHGRRNKLESEVNDYSPRTVDYVLGCGMLIRRDVLRAVGLFNECFFAYYEDLDYCRRVQAAGFRVVAVPRARLWHKVARTMGLDSPRRQYLLAFGSVLFFVRHAGWRWPIIGPYRMGSTLKTILKFALHRRCDLLGAHIRGLKDGWQSVFFAKV
jgi:GT2 family glycosyltransferase